MRKDKAGAGMAVVGVDIGDEGSRYFVVDGEGREVEAGRLPTTEAGLAKWFGKRERCRVAIEAGTQSPWISRLLTKLGHEVVVANPRKLRLIYENDQKTDAADAEYLARVTRMDPKLVKPLHHRSAGTQADLAVLRARSTLVETRTKLVNHVRGVLKSFGVKVTKGSTEAFAKKAREALPEELLPALGPVVETIQGLTCLIKTYDARVKKLNKEKHPRTRRLEQVTGVGPVTALGYELTLEDPGRFRNSRSVAKYLGLIPRKEQSSSRDPQLRITKSGDSMLRSLLVGSAHYILGPFGPDSDLKRFGERIAARGGKNAKKRAVVAVARKLSAVLFSLWKSGETYEALRNSQRSEAVSV